MGSLRELGEVVKLEGIKAMCNEEDGRETQ